MQSPILHWPDGLDTATFLSRHWQRKPLLIRRALPGFRSPLEPDELAGLACEPDVESRLVLLDADRYTLTHGPFSPQALASLPERCWSLLVQDVEKHLPDLAALLEAFAFIPAWRVDDLMVSCAAPGGGVGPHVDQYDVFLVQALGRRRWQIGDPGPPAQRREGSELAILESFRATDEWEVEPGDVLYLPPGVPHCGTALAHNELCMTYSVGFRAPSLPEMLQDLSGYLYQQPGDAPRYSDAGLAPEEAQAGISRATLLRVRDMLRKLDELDEASLAHWFGCLVTEPKAWMRAEVPPEQIDADRMLEALRRGRGLRRHGMVLVTYWHRDDALILFVDGRAMPLDPSLAQLVLALCQDRLLQLDTGSVEHSPLQQALLVQLINEGKLEIADEPHG